jgi:hypothetical protein
MQRVKFMVTSIRWGNLAHLGLNLSVVFFVVLFVRLDLVPLAVASVVAGKWRVIAVQPRHWLANIRANSSDLIVNLSFVVLLVRAESFVTTIIWTLLFVIWLIWLKPQSQQIMVGVQSIVTHFLGLTALFWLSDSINEVVLVIGAWFIALSGARHFLSHFEESLLSIMSFSWAFVVAQLAWLLNRWLIIYPLKDDIIIPQFAVVVSLLGYVLGSLYYLDSREKLRRSYLRQYVAIGCVILLVIILLADWSAIK